MRWGKIAAVALAGAALPGATDAPALPGWMAGCWEEVSGERWTEECWTVPRAGMMMGSGRSGTGEKTANWEVMQIVLETPAAMAFFAAPQGKDRTRFVLVAGGDGLTFTNPANDYPQRIHYRREGEFLLAEIAMLDGSKPMRWRYRRK